MRIRSLPSNSAFSRFFGLVSDRLIAPEQAIAEIVDELKKRLPRMGRKSAVDSTDIESCANPRRTRVIDHDAAWGVRTRKNKTKGERKTEWFFGCKMRSLIDALYGVPTAARFATPFIPGCPFPRRLRRKP